MTPLLAGLPTWIYVLFFALLYLGYTQTKTRLVSRARIVILPVILLSLSFYAALHVPNSTVMSVLVWMAGIRVAFYFSRQFQHGRGVVMHPDNLHYVVPGSWIPLTLLMTAFFAKFTLGYLVGTHAVDPANFDFILFSSALSGLISGTFAARAAHIFQAGTDSVATLNIPNAAKGV